MIHCDVRGILTVLGPSPSYYNNNNNNNNNNNEAEKKLKYNSLCIEIQRMWNLKCTIIPIIIGATGIVARRCFPYSCVSTRH